MAPAAVVDTRGSRRAADLRLLELDSVGYVYADAVLLAGGRALDGSARRVQHTRDPHPCGPALQIHLELDGGEQGIVDCGAHGVIDPPVCRSFLGLLSMKHPYESIPLTLIGPLVDDGLHLATATVYIDVTNTAPVAVNDEYEVLHDQVLTTGVSPGSPDGVLDNGFDQDGVMFEDYGRDADVIHPPVDVDRFTLDLDPGQRLTLAVSPTSAVLLPTVSLFAPDSQRVATATASVGGRDALLQAELGPDAFARDMARLVLGLPPAALMEYQR